MSDYILSLQESSMFLSIMLLVTIVALFLVIVIFKFAIWLTKTASVAILPKLPEKFKTIESTEIVSMHKTKGRFRVRYFGVMGNNSVVELGRRYYEEKEVGDTVELCVYYRALGKVKCYTPNRKYR